MKRESLDGQKHKFKSLKRVLNQYTSDLSDIDFCRAVHSVIYGNLLDDKLLGTFAGWRKVLCRIFLRIREMRFHQDLSFCPLLNL